MRQISEDEEDRFLTARRPDGPVFGLVADSGGVFLGDMLDVGLPKLSRPQQFGLLAAPGIKITIVKRALHGH